MHYHGQEKDPVGQIEKEKVLEREKFYRVLQKMNIDPEVGPVNWNSWNSDIENFKGYWEFRFLDKEKLPEKERALYESAAYQPGNFHIEGPESGVTFSGYKTIFSVADFSNEHLFSKIKESIDKFFWRMIETNPVYFSQEYRKNFEKEVNDLIKQKETPDANYFLTTYLKSCCELPFRDRDIENMSQLKQALNRLDVVQVTKNEFLHKGSNYWEGFWGVSENNSRVKEEIEQVAQGLYSESRSSGINDDIEHVRETYFKVPLEDKLFAGSREKMSKEEKKLAAKEYAELMIQGVFFRESIEKDLGINIIDLSLPEQYQLLKFIKTKKNREIDPIKEAIKKEGTVLLRTFLSLENDNALGDKIIELSNHLPDEVSQKIFSKYAELVDLTGSVAEYVQQFQKEGLELKTLETKERAVQEISEKLLVRAKDVLVHAVNKSPEEILTMLDSVKADAELFKSTFIIEKKNGGVISLENIREANFENKKSGELAEEEKRAMRSLYEKNYASNPAFQKVLLESFDKALENPTTTFYLFKLKNEIKGFDRFDDLGDGKKYFGSFNIDESMQGATLGESMIDQSVNVEAKTGEIIADCSAVNRIGARYIENGFVAVSFTENYYGVPAFSIIRNDPETAQFFKTKQMTQEDLESLVAHPRNDIRVFQADNQELLVPMFNEKVGHSYVLTRYFQNKESGKWCAVLEKIKQSQGQ